MTATPTPDEALRAAFGLLTGATPAEPTPAIAEAPQITWWVWAGAQKMRHTRTMRGTWGWDASCSCGWETRTGGATKSYVKGEVWTHKLIDHGVESSLR